MTRPRLELAVQYASTAPDLPGRTEIRRWVSAALAGRREHAGVSVRIVGAEEGRALNARWRGVDHATNVLSFPVGYDPLAKGLLGDIVICAPVLAREAREQHKPPGAHWAHMVVHGTLHLIGYDHGESREAEEMESLERDVLARLGYPDPYAVTQS